MDSEYQKFNPMRRQLRPNENGPYSAQAIVSLLIFTQMVSEFMAILDK